MLSRLFKRKEPRPAEQQPTTEHHAAEQPPAKAPMDLSQFEEKKRQLVRKAWKPVTVDGEGPLAASRFSGRAWLDQDEPWPTCQNCGKPMQLFLQLNLDEVPDAIRGEFGHGLLQMFFCTNPDDLCAYECNSYLPFAKSELVRLVSPGVPKVGVDIPDIEDYFAPRQIVGWSELEDYPYFNEETGNLGVKLSDDEQRQLIKQGYPLSGDKLAGWPAWAQDVAYPSCPICGTTMGLVFQIDAKDNLPYEFGDAGCGQITQCPAHKEQLAFVWDEG